MLGGNALAAYDIDAAALWKIAARIGPAKQLFIEQAA
jgi:hypothetical protein